MLSRKEFVKRAILAVSGVVLAGKVLAKVIGDEPEFVLPHQRASKPVKPAPGTTVPKYPKMRLIIRAAEKIEGYPIVPVGGILNFRGPLPRGYLECDGARIPRRYVNLRSFMGDRTPDFRGFLVPAGFGSPMYRQKYFMEHI